MAAAPRPYPPASAIRLQSGAFPNTAGFRFQFCGPAVSLCLLLFDDPATDTVSKRIVLDPARHVFGELWTIDVPEARIGQGYAWLVNEANEWLIDPCATRIGGRTVWGSPSKVRDKGLIDDRTFDWGDDMAPNTPLAASIVYEAHLRGYTAREANGTCEDFRLRIPHLKRLGVTAVEFLPVHHFNEQEYPESDARSELKNYWGYSTLSFMAPMSRYGSPREFKQLIKELHAAGIEVWLDVVYNHTGESNDSPWSFCGIDRDAYYMLGLQGEDMNYSGCGNTFSPNSPRAMQHILDSLRYWIAEYHIDGFRFDLGSILCRADNGVLLEQPPLIQAMEADPILRGSKLIAEAWDAAGAYQVGHFPGTTFSEWNGKYRDDIRRFWLTGDRNMLSGLATRIAGSDDLYRHRPLGPAHSVNFVTCHDGFTLKDLVSYNEKHNEANREDNRDGENHNMSRNFGAEGETDDPAIRAARLKMQKNLLATLLLSRGIPMLTAGDEFGRTQKGTNNAYCQDNEVSWVDWSLLDTHRELVDFTRELIALRKASPAYARDAFLDEIHWHGPNQGNINWQGGRALAMEVSYELFFAINAWDRPIRFALPAGTWELRLSSGATSEDGELEAESVAIWVKTAEDTDDELTETATASNKPLPA